MCDSSDASLVGGRFLVGCRFLPHTPSGPAQDDCQFCEFSNCKSLLLRVSGSNV